MFRFLHVCILLAAGTAVADTFIVTNLGDHEDLNPGNGFCGDLPAPEVGCTLRAAIQEANADPNEDHEIQFVAVTGRISLDDPLPALAGNITIDGSTAFAWNDQAGDIADAPPVVIVDGAALSSGNGFRVLSGLVVIRSLAIVNFPQAGIRVEPSAVLGISEGNWIGVDPDGTAAGNGTGVIIDGTTLLGASGLTVSDPLVANVISANGNDGVRVLNDGDDSIIAGNRIGSDPAGNTGMGNGGAGITGSLADNLAIGIAGAGNIILDHAEDGIILLGNDIVVEGNRVGVPQSGLGFIGNGGDGISVLGSRAMIISNSASGNGGDGINLAGADSEIRDNIVTLNDSIGIDEGGAGSNFLTQNSVIDNGSHGVTLLGTETVMTNSAVRGNGASDATTHQVLVEGNLIRVDGNMIGAIASVAVVLGDGISVTGDDNTIGLISSANRLAYHSRDEIHIAGDGNSVVANDIGVAGVTDDQGRGIFVSGDSNVVQLNDVRRQLAVGIFLENARFTDVTSNTVTGVTDAPGSIINFGITIDANSEDSDIAGNVIGSFVGAGIGVQGNSATHRLSANLIGDVGGIPIDLGLNGPTANDDGDADSGVNNLQNFPDLENASFDVGTSEVTFNYVVRTADANATYPLTIQFYEPNSALGDDPGDPGVLLSTVNYNLPHEQLVATLPVSDVAVTALVIDAVGNTSEVSPPLVFRLPEVLFASSFEAGEMP